MNRIGIVLLFAIIFSSCYKENQNNFIAKVNWDERKSNLTNFDAYHLGETYLPIYSHIYHRFDNHTFDLTITVSIRNISIADTIFILKSDYYNTKGENIRQYVKNPVYISPMETLEIVIKEEDKEGGSGANFVFDWAVKNPNNPPLFEAVMISTYGQQGISFTTRGIQVFQEPSK